MDLNYRYWPCQKKSSKTIIAIHGLFGSLENLGMVTRQLKENYSVYALDLPNHGRSYHCKNSSLSSMANDVISWMDNVGLAKVCLLGHSLGGKVSMEIALRYPERVESLVVADIAPVTYSRRHDDVFKGFGAVDLSTIKTRIDADKAMSEFINEASTRSFLLKNLAKEKGVWFWRLNLDALLKNYNEFISSNVDVDEVKPFHNPILFIKGELSEYILPKYTKATTARFPNASVKVINETGHWLHAEKPDVFSGIVQRFLD